MSGRSLGVAGALMVFAAALISYVLVYLTPWFGRPAPHQFDYYGGWRTVDVWRDAPPQSVTELSKLNPKEFHEVVESLYDQLHNLSDAELVLLGASGNAVCTSFLVDCHGLPAADVRPFVERVLAVKQARQTTDIAAGSLETSKLSLFVSFASLLVAFGGFVIAFLMFRLKRKEEIVSLTLHPTHSPHHIPFLKSAGN